MKSAAGRCEKMFALVRRGRRNPAWVNAATALACVRYEENRLAEADTLCREALPLLSVASTVENFTSNPEIGARSRIAVSTAKWHLKNVFAKLDVSTRTGAIARARELQLLD